MIFENRRQPAAPAHDAVRSTKQEFDGAGAIAAVVMLVVARYDAEFLTLHFRLHRFDRESHQV
jgi:hypothetical protein